MDRLVYIYYPLLILLLFTGAKISRRGEWNDEVLSLRQTKAFLGFQAILIIFHHCSQRTAAPWLDKTHIHHGLDVFVFIGYLCVAAFFFCSGYGMYVSLHHKDNALSHYFSRRILPLLAAGFITWMMFFIAEMLMGYTAPEPYIFKVNTYIWYIPVMILMYVLFYLSFRFCRNETAAIAVLTVCAVLYFIWARAFFPGTWWYNTHFLFVIGVIVAKQGDGFFSAMKKLYFPVFVLCFSVFTVCFMFGNYYYQVCGHFRIRPDEAQRVMLEPFLQAVSAVAFVIIMIQAGMKLRIGNRILDMLGAFTLEIYIIHPLFVRLFGFASFEDNVKPLYYIRNQFLYVLTVIVISLPIAYGLHLLKRKIFR